MSYISLDQCIAGAKLDLNIETTNYDSRFMLWANDAIRQFNCMETMVKQTSDITIDSQGRIPLPNGFYRMLMAKANPAPQAATTDPLNPTQPTVAALYYYDALCLKDCGVTGGWENIIGGSYQIQGDYMYLHGDFSSYTSITICYLGLNLDDSGKFKATDEMELAIRAYISYKYAFLHPKEFPAWQIREFREWWLAKFNQVNGDSQVRYFNNVRPQIMMIMNSLIADKTIRISP